MLARNFGSKCRFWPRCVFEFDAAALICVSVHGSAEAVAASPKPVYLGGVMKSLRESDAAGVNSRQ